MLDLKAIMWLEDFLQVLVPYLVFKIAYPIKSSGLCNFKCFVCGWGWLNLIQYSLALDLITEVVCLSKGGGIFREVPTLIKLISWTT